MKESEHQMSLFPPRTSNIDALAQFFDHVDSMDLSGGEDVTRLPEHKTELVTVSIRLLKDDVRSIKTLASQVIPRCYGGWFIVLCKHYPNNSKRKPASQRSFRAVGEIPNPV